MEKNDGDTSTTMDRLTTRLKTFQTFVTERGQFYTAYHLVFDALVDETGGEYVLRIVHDTTRDLSVATMRQCRTYIVVSGAKKLREEAEVRVCVVHGKTSVVDAEPVDRLLRRILSTVRPEPTLNCRDPRMGASSLCTFGIQPARLRRPADAGSPAYTWNKVLERPTTGGREIVSKGLFRELSKRDSPLWTQIKLEERVMKRGLPVSLKYRWRLVNNKPSGEPLKQCDTLMTFLRNTSVIQNNDIWNACLITPPLFETHYVFDHAEGKYYIPAPVDLAHGDFLELVPDKVYYVYSGDPHMNQGSVPLEDRRYVYLPAFTWSGRDCDTSSMLSALDQLP